MLCHIFFIESYRFFRELLQRRHLLMPGIRLRKDKVCPSCASGSLRYMAEKRRGGWQCSSCNYRLELIKHKEVITPKLVNLNALTWKNTLPQRNALLRVLRRFANG